MVAAQSYDNTDQFYSQVPMPQNVQSSANPLPQRRRGEHPLASTPGMWHTVPCWRGLPPETNLLNVGMRRIWDGAETHLLVREQKSRPIYPAPLLRCIRKYPRRKASGPRTNSKRCCGRADIYIPRSTASTAKAARCRLQEPRDAIQTDERTASNPHRRPLSKDVQRRAAQGIPCRRTSAKRQERL